MFISANVSTREENSSNPVNALVRYEFIEFLVRIAKYKYKDAGLVNTCVESFERLMNELVLPYHAVHCQDWQPFRENYLHKNVIDNLMYTNKKGLEIIFIKMASDQKNKAFTVAKAFQVMRDLGLNLSDQAVTYAFGMSQSTVDNETKKAGMYERIIFIEFIEYLCRILYTTFKSEQESNLMIKDSAAGG